MQDNKQTDCPFEERIVSSLDKIFFSRKLEAPPFEGLAAARGETAAFQIAVRTKPEDNRRYFLELEPLSVPPGCEVRIRTVGHVACTSPAYDWDPFILTAEPGIFPDPLLPRHELWMRPGYWMSYWVDFRPGQDAAAGRHDLSFRLLCRTGAMLEVLAEKTITVEAEVRDFALPPPRLRCMLWFYPDCLMRYYRAEAWSELHWELIGNYLRDLAAHGGNCLLTPLWTLHLGLPVGGERPKCQLLKISCRNGVYSFDFSRLDRWIALARECGIDCFDMAHAYSSWGAKYPPTIYVEEEEGVERPRMGWNADGNGEEYRDFLRQLMPPLLAFLRSCGVTPDKCYFHVSDEPEEKDLENYGKAVGFMRGLLGEYPTCDAMSNVKFLDQGLTRIPIPLTNRAGDFQNREVAERWVYYCGNSQDGVPNRQFGQPSWRNRVLGILLYWLRMDGFLNWGYNYWFSRQSYDQGLNPWQNTCAGGHWCGGGSFVVYPGHDGHPVSSIHYEVFADALQDLRALELLESLVGREATMDVIRKTLPDCFGDLAMTHYPHEREWVFKVRDAVDTAIAEAAPPLKDR